MTTNWLLLALVIVALEKAVPSSGRHRHGQMPGCSKCPPGHLLSKKCYSRHDSECTPCPLGTYQPHHSYRSYCYLCSKCGDELYVAHACTPLRDTVCDSCHTYRGPHNADYQQKCLRELKKAWTTPAPLEDGMGMEWTSENRRTKAVLVDDKARGRRLALAWVLCGGLFVVTCLIILFLVSNKLCRKDRKTVKPGYRYQIVKATEPAML